MPTTIVNTTPSTGYWASTGNVTVSNSSVVGSSSSGSLYPQGTIHGNTWTTKPAVSDELPPILIEGHDDAGNKVTMTLKPEANISSSDVIKIMMLSITVMMVGTGSFNPLNYVKTHNLERHFKYV
jgi:hypothetical protein